jgi:ketosteroid isomerase-like protein
MDTDTADITITDITIDDVADRYLAVWSEPDPERRRRAVADLWAEDGVEFVETGQFRGHEELDTRITAAYDAFVGNGRFTVTSADDVFGHHNAVTFTVQLATGDGQVAWAARVFLLLDEDARIRADYQMTVHPLTA